MFRSRHGESANLLSYFSRLWQITFSIETGAGIMFIAYVGMLHCERVLCYMGEVSRETAQFVYFVNYLFILSVSI